jgi:hypothetical protein
MLFKKNKTETFVNMYFGKLVSWEYNFIILGPTDQKLWEYENFGRSLGRVSKLWSQPARIDHISLKRWATRRRRFEKSSLRVSSLVSWTLRLHLGGWNLPFLMQIRDFIKKKRLKLEYGITFTSIFGIVV